MGDYFNIPPFPRKCAACVTPPGSKSITNRSLILSALRGNKIVLNGALFSRDTLIMADCLRKLGYIVVADDDLKTVKISPAKSLSKKANLFVGNAGTAARFVTAFVALIDGGDYFFDSDIEMRVRPIKGLLQALQEQGAEFEFTEKEWAFPFRMRTHGLRGGKLKLDASASSQILSALLMVGGFARSPLEIELIGGTVSKPFVDMTISIMRDFGIKVDSNKGTNGAIYNFSNFKCDACDSVNAGEYRIEPDATAASYFAGLPFVTGGACFISGLKLSSIQGDSKFFSLIADSGFVNVEELGDGVIVYQKFARDDTYYKGGKSFDFCDISDTFPTLAAIAPLAAGTTEICGILHTRLQECDRVATVAYNLRELGTGVEENESSLKVIPPSDPKKKVRGFVTIKTEFDHRMAMCFSILGTYPLFGEKSWMKVESPDCVSKTYPDFYADLDGIRIDSQKFRIVAVDGGAAVGKSSVSKACAEILGYMHVDTGSHYRTITYGLLKLGVSPESEEAVAKALRSFNLGTIIENGSAKMMLNGLPVVDSEIRNSKINANVSHFAAIPAVRNFIKNYQISMANYASVHDFGGMIMEGRDIGSVIFPNATVKIFLDADEVTRSERRAKEGIIDSISERDKIDSTRKVAPLKCAEDAKRIDTSHLTKKNVIARALSLIVHS